MSSHNGLVMVDGVWITQAEVKRRAAAAARAEKASAKATPAPKGKRGNPGKNPVAAPRRVGKKSKGRGSLLDLYGWAHSVAKGVSSGMKRAGHKSPALLPPTESPHDKFAVDSTEGILRMRFRVSQEKRQGACVKISCSYKKWAGRAKAKTGTVKVPLFMGKVSSSEVAKEILETCKL